MTTYRHVRRNQRKGGTLHRHLRQGGKRRRKRTHGPEKRGKLAGKPMIGYKTPIERFDELLAVLHLGC